MRCSSDPSLSVAHHSFSAAQGPLPHAVRARVADACRPAVDGALSMAFTSPAFHALQAALDAALRAQLQVPDDVDILFLPCSASTHFALVPMNLLRATDHALYVDSGHWSARAISEARRYGRIETVPAQAACAGIRSGARYCHYTVNETADGLQFHTPPAVDVPLVADMTSALMSAPIDWSRHGLVYAGAQKSLGIAGLSLVFVRRDLLRDTPGTAPRVLDYGALSAGASRLSTPPVFAMHCALHMLEWIAAQGGTAALQARQRTRAGRIHALLDQADRPYRLRTPPHWRSRINPCFDLAQPGLDAVFLRDAAAAGLHGLAGHPDRGGLRISLYVGQNDVAIDALCDFLDAWTPERP
ncbi:MAG: 3-phosphoserine/phosphohydroxythreonine transaminase [Methyloversatilis sp.]|nr:3-phosphoserine/phosphohydroxythreonine transaminase [Methyloversatilis sp.]